LLRTIIYARCSEGSDAAVLAAEDLLAEIAMSAVATATGDISAAATASTAIATSIFEDPKRLERPRKNPALSLDNGVDIAPGESRTERAIAQSQSQRLPQPHPSSIKLLAKAWPDGQELSRARAFLFRLVQAGGTGQQLSVGVNVSPSLALSDIAVFRVVWCLVPFLLPITLHHLELLQIAFHHIT
jgi:hypothetical protein